MKWTYLKLVILCFLCPLTLACAQPLENPKIETLKEQPAAKQAENPQKPEVSTIYQQVSSIIRLSCQQNNQCKTIGVGVSPCGGYGKHFVYSIESTDVLKLSKIVTEYNSQQKLNNKKKELTGICRFISPPKTACAQKTCLTANGAAM